MAVLNTLLTVSEFSRLPQPEGGIRQELHHGQLVESPPVKMLHTRIQKRLVSLLESQFNPAEYVVIKEFPFCPAVEHEVWVADIAVVEVAALNRTDDDEYFQGVPLVVVEVLSLLNTASEMLAREDICLRNGGREFWLVDPQHETVKVIHANGTWRCAEDAVTRAIFIR